MAAASAGKVAELQQGTLTKSKEGIKSLAAGMEKVLKNFGIQSLDAIDQIPDEVKTTLNLQLKTVTGMELGQLRSVIEAAKETGKTFSDRLQDINKKREKNLTLEERTALAEEERRLKVSKSLDILTALDESAKGAADMSMALSTFGKRSKDFEKDVQAMGGNFGSGIEAARVSISTSIAPITIPLTAAIAANLPAIVSNSFGFILTLSSPDLTKFVKETINLTIIGPAKYNNAPIAAKVPNFGNNPLIPPVGVGILIRAPITPINAPANKSMSAI